MWEMTVTFHRLRAAERPQMKPPFRTSSLHVLFTSEQQTLPGTEVNHKETISVDGLNSTLFCTIKMKGTEVPNPRHISACDYETYESSRIRNQLGKLKISWTRQICEQILHKQEQNRMRMASMRVMRQSSQHTST